MQFTAQYPQMEIHKAGCRDLKRQFGDTTDTQEAENVKEFIEGQLAGDLDEMGYTAQDFRVLPCAKGK